jgi:hypothetical protein
VVESAAPGVWLTAAGGLGPGCRAIAESGGVRVTPAWPGRPSLPQRPPALDELVALAAVSGGTRLDAATAARDVAALVDRRLPVAPVPFRWHPMRARWWFIPFVAVLGLEWWRRRQQGRA